MEGNSAGGANRALIGIALVALFVLLVAFLLLTLISEIDCEDLNTVQCDDERAGGWSAVRGLLILAIMGGLLFAGAMAMSRRIWSPVVGYMVLAPIAAMAYIAVGEIEVEDRAIPKLTEANILEIQCFQSKAPRCEDGIPVEFAVTEPAEIVFSMGLFPEQLKDRTFETTAIGLEQDSGSRAYSFEAGSHTVRLTTEVVRVGPLSPPGALGTWPPGDYELLMNIEPDDAGTQATEDQNYEAAFVVSP